MESGTGAPSRREEEVRSDSGRSFLLEANFYGNGCFLAISEGERRIGAISVALSSQNNTAAAKVIPSKSDPIFVNTVAEKVASMTNGICIVSFYAKSQLKLEDMKAIMGGVMHIVEAEGNNNGK